MYTFLTPAGRLSIRPGQNNPGSCELWLNEETIAKFESASAAARCVAQKRTGRVEIDKANVSLPGDVERWRWTLARATASRANQSG
jgi:hypothetical protein